MLTKQTSVYRILWFLSVCVCDLIIYHIISLSVQSVGLKHKRLLSPSSHLVLTLLLFFILWWHVPPTSPGPRDFKEGRWANSSVLFLQQWLWATGGKLQPVGTITVLLSAAEQCGSEIRSWNHWLSVWTARVWNGLLLEMHTSSLYIYNFTVVSIFPSFQFCSWLSAKIIRFTAVRF